MGHVPKQLPSSLQGLDLVGMGITSLKSGDFANLSNLQTLSLWKNSIKTIQDQTFTNLNKVEILELFENRIERLTNNTFTGLSGLQKLDITENQIESVDSGMNFEKTTKFHSLKKVILHYFHCLSTVIMCTPPPVFSYNA